MIELRGLSRRFGSKSALADVSFSIAKGEKVALLGPNGSGKTTLFRILTGLLSPSSGEAAVDGISLLRDPILAKARIGFAPSSDGGFFPRFTGRENLEFFAHLRGLQKARAEEAIARCAGLAPLAEALTTPFAHCSSGMRQTLALTRALIGNPPVLLLDEPTRSLDPETTASFHEFLKDRLEGATLFFSTHYVTEAFEVADRQIRLRGGRLEALEGSA